MFSTGRNKQVSINDTLLKNAEAMLSNTVTPMLTNSSSSNSSSSSSSSTNNNSITATTAITSNNNTSAVIQTPSSMATTIHTGVDTATATATATATTTTSHARLSRSMSMPLPASTSLSHFPMTARGQGLPAPVQVPVTSVQEPQLSNTLEPSSSSHIWAVDRHTLLTSMSPVHLTDYTIDDVMSATSLSNDHNMTIGQRSTIIHSITSTNALQVIFQSSPVNNHTDNRNNNITNTNSHCEIVSINRDCPTGQHQLLSVLLHHIAPPPLELPESSQRWLSMQSHHTPSHPLTHLTHHHFSRNPFFFHTV